MELIGIAILAAGLMGVWHVTKHAVPRTMRAIGAHRRQAVTAWRNDHPGAPTVTRWAATVAKTVAALRWGPRYLVQETGRAWREGMDAGRLKYGVPVVDQSVPDRADPNDTKNCPECRGEVVVDGQICPRCLAAQEKRNKEYEASQPPLAQPRPPGQRPSPRPRLVAVPTEPNPKENTVAIETATGGEIANAEQFHAEAQTVAKEAAADLEDATADSARAQEDLVRIENMVAALSKQQAVAGDIAAVAALKDPAAARSAAAKDRLAAAEKRLAGAKAVVEVAAKHVQLIGIATGPFYNAA